MKITSILLARDYDQTKEGMKEQVEFDRAINASHQYSEDEDF